MRNLADSFDLAINSMGMNPDDIGANFSASFVANAIEKGHPNYLSGKSAVEMLVEILGQDVLYNQVSMDRSPEYWAGRILAYSQWYLDMPFQQILTTAP